MSIDTIYNIDNQLFGGDVTPIIFDFLSIFIENFQKKETIFEVGISLWCKEMGIDEEMWERKLKTFP